MALQNVGTKKNEYIEGPHHIPFNYQRKLKGPDIRIPLTKPKQEKSQTSTVRDGETDEQREQQATGCYVNIMQALVMHH